MTHESYPVSIWIVTAGVFVGIVTGLVWGGTNCSWWQHSFCNDTATTGFISTITFVGIVVAILMFLLGGATLEINMEARLPPPEIYNEAREEYERQSIIWRPFVPNLMIVTGLILAVGVNMAILGALSAQYDRDFYQSLYWLSFASGVTVSSAGFYLKRKWTHRAPASPSQAETDR